MDDGKWKGSVGRVFIIMRKFVRYEMKGGDLHNKLLRYCIAKLCVKEGVR